MPGIPRAVVELQFEVRVLVAPFGDGMEHQQRAQRELAFVAGFERMRAEFDDFVGMPGLIGCELALLLEQHAAKGGQVCVDILRRSRRTR